MSSNYNARKTNREAKSSTQLSGPFKSRPFLSPSNIEIKKIDNLDMSAISNATRNVKTRALIQASPNIQLLVQ